MQLNGNIVQVDIKLTDAARQIISQLNGGLTLKCFSLGDSDVNYELSPNINSNRILNAPYNPPGIKYPLIFNGAGKGLKGSISSFLRYVDANGVVSSIYSYPPSLTFSPGNIPPTLQNGFNFSQINFTNVKMGVIVYFQSLLAYYMDSVGNQKRLSETYDIKVLFNGIETIPAGWQIIKDINHGSLLLGKDNTVNVTPGNYQGTIQITGQLTRLTSTLQFNM